MADDERINQLGPVLETAMDLNPEKLIGILALPWTSYMTQTRNLNSPSFSTVKQKATGQIGCL